MVVTLSFPFEICCRINHGRDHDEDTHHGLDYNRDASLRRAIVFIFESKIPEAYYIL